MGREERCESSATINTTCRSSPASSAVDGHLSVYSFTPHNTESASMGSSASFDTYLTMWKSAAFAAASTPSSKGLLLQPSTADSTIP